MDNTTYTKFYEENKVGTPEVEVPEIKEEEIKVPEIKEEVPEIKEEEIKEPEEPKELVGVVDNCTRLRVRKDPTSIAAVLKIINVGAKVKILDEAGEDFYKVQVAGITGFCMKEYITVE